MTLSYFESLRYGHEQLGSWQVWLLSLCMLSGSVNLQDEICIKTLKKLTNTP